MYDTIRAAMGEAVPFARHAGVELTEIGDGSASARLVQRGELSNHLGTIHAGALFTLAETASGGAVAGAFAETIGSLRPVAAEARIVYLKLAKGEVRCAAVIAEPAEALRARLRDEGKIVFEVRVIVTREDGETVATMSVTWHVRAAGSGAGT